jgi:hypothetical protein
MKLLLIIINKKYFVIGGAAYSVLEQYKNRNSFNKRLAASHATVARSVDRKYATFMRHDRK